MHISAVHLALNRVATKDLLNTLLNIVEKRESEKPQNTAVNQGVSDTDQSDKESNPTYLPQLKCVETLLEEAYGEEQATKALRVLGNDVAAHKSVIAALFSFLKAQNTMEGFCDTNPFQRTLELAMSFGGDSDTIMSMAGALAGAYYGEKDIPNYLISLCEGIVDAQKQADELFSLISQGMELS